jgi:hypothetical protein
MKYFFGLVMMLNVILSLAADAEGQREKKYKFFDLHDKFYHNRLYLYWGYNRDRYSNSNIHIYGKGFNFTIYDVGAHDKPTKFSAAVYFGPSTLTIPQYNYRLGFFIKHNIHISVGMDHMKYVAALNQTVMMTGYIDSSISQKYGGVYNNRPVEITPDFLTVQHTNGLNSVTLDVAWLLPIFHTNDDILHIGWNFGTGGVFVVTRTQIHFMGVWYPNSFHLSGVTWPAYTGPRIDLWKCFFFAAELKGGYVYLPWAPFIGSDQSGLSHHFTYMEYYIVGGLSFPLDKKEYPFIKWKKKKAQQMVG